MRIIRLIIVMLFSFAVAACGGGTSTTTPASPATPVAGIGLLIDSPVGGVTYAATPSGKTGTTDAQGAYNFNVGDTVKFTLGSLDLGTVTATGIVTPTELAAGDSNKLTNLLVLLQSLDLDGDSSNGIFIPPLAAAAVTNAIVLTVAPTSLNTAALQTAMTAGGIGTPIVTTTDAAAHYLAEGMKMLSSNIWVGRPNADRITFIRYAANGEYLLGAAGVTGDAGTSGVEYGGVTLLSFDEKGYKWSATSSVDTNLNWGFNPQSAQSCDWVSTNGDGLNFTEGTLSGMDCINNVKGGTISKAENNSAGIVGVWALGSATTINTQHFAFLANGNYLTVDPIGGIDNGIIQPPGVESGSYTYNAATKVLQLSNITIDTNGTAGLSNNGTANSGVLSINLGGGTAELINGDGVFTIFRVSDLPASSSSPSPYAGTWAAEFKLKTIGTPNLCGGTPGDIDVAHNMGSIVVDNAGNFVVMNDLNTAYPMMVGTIAANGQLNATWYGDTLLPPNSGGSTTCPAGTVSGTMTDTSNGVVTLFQGGDTGTIKLTHVP